MNYVLVKDRQQVLLGPMPWRKRFFQSELEEQEANYLLTDSEPSSRLVINSSLEIIPCNLLPADYNALYQEPAGPFWTFTDELATGTFSAIDYSIDRVKGNLKQVTATKRYEKEVAGTSVTINDAEVLLDTSREGRNQYSELLAGIGEGVIQFKYNNVFITINASNVQLMVDAVHDHVQTQFNWEKTICDAIDAATDIDALKLIESTQINV